ncbi:hypothetical protein [Spongiimicrobium salis]|uniref:hypothetical protein n=1 Tax=Spongiimicrobium salis TaxID=1667022 RepID=UPI00374D5BC4
MEYIQQKFIRDILFELIYHEKGYLKVANNGLQWAAIQLGTYYVMDHTGQLKTPVKSKASLLNIFTGLINIFQRFEHNGVHYYYDNGKWKKSHLAPQFKWPVE